MKYCPAASARIGRRDVPTPGSITTTCTVFLGKKRYAWASQPAEVVFTSGGTEADNLALLGTVRPAGTSQHVITTAIEHPAVMNTCAQLEREGVTVTYVPVGASGVVDPNAIRRALRRDTVLVSVMHANNELGTVQPIAEIARFTR